MDLVYNKSQDTWKVHVNLGLGTGPLFWCTGPSFWIQWRNPFLWSQQGFGTKVRDPSQVSEDSNCSNTLTTCQNSGLLSGCKLQHCLIRARIAGGQSDGITGLEFWRNTITHKYYICKLSFEFQNKRRNNIQEMADQPHSSKSDIKKGIKVLAVKYSPQSSACVYPMKLWIYQLYA